MRCRLTSLLFQFSKEGTVLAACAAFARPWASKWETGTSSQGRKSLWRCCLITGAQLLYMKNTLISSQTLHFWSYWLLSQTKFHYDHNVISYCRYLLLVLMEAERAWSYAMQLKQEANTEPRKRFHLLSRLRKAAKNGERLERLCESPRVDAKTKLEAQVRAAVLLWWYLTCLSFLRPETGLSWLVFHSQAYTSYLSGMVQFELQQWKAAMEAFNKCKYVLPVIVWIYCKTSRAVHEVFDVCTNGLLCTVSSL